MNSGYCIGDEPKSSQLFKLNSLNILTFAYF